MINGEGAEEKASSAVTSPRDPPGDRDSDCGDELSHYSSCGGESEFERYGSASSAMGTPSFRSCSFQDSDFGSLKSFKLGVENPNFKSSGAKKLLSSVSNQGTEFSSNEMDDGVVNMSRRMDGFMLSVDDLNGSFDVGDNWGSYSNNMGSTEGITTIQGGFQEIVEGRVVREDDNDERLEMDEGADRNLVDQSEASSRYELSEGEDSMFGCGSDDERIGTYYVRNVPSHGEKCQNNENQLAMNSAVAFGSDDWDDFVQESAESTIISMVPYEFKSEGHHGIQSGIGISHFPTANSGINCNLILSEGQNDARSAPAASSQVQSSDRLAVINANTLFTNSTDRKFDVHVSDVKGFRSPSNHVRDVDESKEYIGHSSAYNIFETNKVPLEEEALETEELKNGRANSTDKHEDKSSSELIASGQDIELISTEVKETGIELDLLSESVPDHNMLVPEKHKELGESNSGILFSLADTNSSAATKSNSGFTFNQIENHFLPVKTRNFEFSDVYDELVNDMEDILLDSGDSLGSRFMHNYEPIHSQIRRSSRDGGSSASTSGKNFAFNWNQQPLRIDRVEVVGARQKEGDVSLSERLVGVKKYTVYKIRVWSGEDQWEVERRYRDFSTLYYRLKKLFDDRGWTLPSTWSFVEKESRKLFGNASPDVIANRSVLIQECLQSIIHPKFCSSSFNALICFLSPSEVIPDSPASDTSKTQSPFPSERHQLENSSSLGKKISLVVQIYPPKSVKQMLDAQHYRCAGCHRNFDDGRTRMQEFVRALGWGKPRLCEYSGQLFCSVCHNNDTAILPARVLHYWDFSWYQVSQLAKSYLDSIYDQPMLCVSAVNPFLFSKVPTLQHVANIRNKIRAMLPYVHCPFRASIYKGLGARRYLLESNDFFALRDLIDLSKGVFSALPVMVETVSRKIEEHIMEQCLICYDAGVPCSARQACERPLSLIFPFQEKEVKKCKTCGLVFHKNCFKKIAVCPCDTRFKREDVIQSVERGNHNGDRNSNVLGKTVGSSRGLLAGLFSKAIPQRSLIFGKNDHQHDATTIPMDSLPNSSL